MELLYIIEFKKKLVEIGSSSICPMLLRVTIIVLVYANTQVVYSRIRIIRRIRGIRTEYAEYAGFDCSFSEC